MASTEDRDARASYVNPLTFPDFSYSRDPELQQLAAQVRDELDNVDIWVKLVEASQTQEGGLNRNSNPQAISATRETFDYLLARFPLFFGFWKKYADLEFTIGGPEAAEMIYERGIASVGTSVDLWTSYCTFRAETSHDPDVIRVLFERAIDCAGLDFQAHPLWDKYLEYEERLEEHERIFVILKRLIHIPLHQYARYFEKFTNMAQHRPLEELAEADVLQEIQMAVSHEFAQRPSKPAEIEREIRSRCHELHKDIFTRTQAETTKRWVFEQEIRRPYFHVSELGDPELQNWRKYLDFEESESGHARVRFLYERCLVTTALYDEFWLRYARWLLGQSKMVEVLRIEEARYIYRRACCIFVPVSRPAIRLNYAKFEESLGNFESAIEILEDVLRTTPDHVDTMLAVVNVYRRFSGVDAAISALKKYMQGSNDTQVRSALFVEQARLVWRIKGDPAGARKIFESNHQSALASPKFWLSWFDFETAQATSQDQESVVLEKIRHVYDLVRSSAHLTPEAVEEIASLYFRYLDERGGKDAMKAYIELDREVNGPQSITAAEPDTASGDSQKPRATENGHARGASGFVPLR